MAEAVQAKPGWPIPRIKPNHTCLYHVARGVHFADEELQANDGVDDNDKEDQQGDVEQGDHGFNYGV